jgi:hypothetical protein
MILNVKIMGKQVSIEIDDREFAEEFRRMQCEYFREGEICDYCGRVMIPASTEDVKHYDTHCGWCVEKIKDGMNE